MAAQIALSCLLLLTMLLMQTGSSFVKGEETFSGGELLDVIWQMTSIGLDYWPKADGSTPTFYIYNDNLKRYFQLKDGRVDNHVTVLGSIRLKPQGNQFQLPRLEQGFITFAIDNESGVASGNALNGQLQTGDWLNDPSHQWVPRRGSTVNAVFLVNRSTGFCVAADVNNDNPVSMVTCDETALKQQWQFCQDLTNDAAPGRSDLGADRVCWPRDSIVNSHRAESGSRSQSN